MELNYEEKKKALFDSLATAEKSVLSNSSSLKQSTKIDYKLDRDGKSRHNSNSDKRITKSGFVNKFRGKESIFKRPEAPIDKCLPHGRRPDFKMNPEKWTKYSLEDVDTSDRTNTAAAFAFLREIEEQKSCKNQEKTEEKDIKVTFNKSIRLKKKFEEEPKESDKGIVRGSTLLMPEYVIGQKIKKDKKKISFGQSSSSSKHTEPTKSTKQMKLDHLMDDEEDDEEEEENYMD